MDAVVAFAIVHKNISSIFQISENYTKVGGLHSSKTQNMFIKGI